MSKIHMIQAPAPIAYSIVNEEAPIRIKPSLRNASYNGVISLSAIPVRNLYGMVKALYKFNNIEVLIIWNHFMLERTMKEIEDIFHISIAKQRVLYSKYKKHAKFYEKIYQEE